MIFEGDETRDEVLAMYESVLESIGGYVSDLQTKVRIGVYSEDLHGSLEDVLDRIGEMLR